ncbi:MAG: hypothetical protein J6Q19_00605 [Bacteroidaceae bacterium]|nr:hypothetical protein [Bacteroidaceae bacterium]
MNNFFAQYRIWLRDRETRKLSCFVVGSLVHDIVEGGLNLMIEHSDNEYVCVRVDFICIVYFQLGGAEYD